MALQVFKDQALVSNTHLQEAQIDLLQQLHRLQYYVEHINVLSKDISKQQKGQYEDENSLQLVSKMKISNPNAPLDFPRLDKDKRIEYDFLIESWKFECSMVRAFIDQAKELVEDVWIFF